MKRNGTFLSLMLTLVLLLAGCGGRGNAAQTGGMEQVDTGDSRAVIITLEGTDIPQAQVRVFLMEEQEDGSYAPGEALIPAFDGVDTHCLMLSDGGNYTLEVTNSQGQTVQYYLMLEDSVVCSFHICLDLKEETGVRFLWPQTPHGTLEPQ